MARTQYFIVLHEDEWNIKLGNKHYGPYKSQTGPPSRPPTRMA
jgi:hypothetical protein